MKRKLIVILLGIVFTLLASFYISLIENSTNVVDKTSLNLILYRDSYSSKYLYFFVALIINFSVILNLYITDKDNKYKQVLPFLKTSILLYLFIYLFVYLLTYLTVYIAFLNPIFCFLAYALSIKYIYKLKNISVNIIAGILFLFIGTFIMNFYESLEYLDEYWFLCFTTILPLKINKRRA